MSQMQCKTGADQSSRLLRTDEPSPVDGQQVDDVHHDPHRIRGRIGVEASTEFFQGSPRKPGTDDVVLPDAPHRRVEPRMADARSYGRYW